jgi:hypothetical protein
MKKRDKEALVLLVDLATLAFSIFAAVKIITLMRSAKSLAGLPVLLLAAAVNILSIIFIVEYRRSFLTLFIWLLNSLLFVLETVAFIMAIPLIIAGIVCCAIVIYALATDKPVKTRSCSVTS